MLKIITIFAMYTNVNVMKKLVGLFFFICLVCVSCKVAHDTYASGKATIITVDTTYVNHGGNISFPRK